MKEVTSWLSGDSKPLLVLQSGFHSFKRLEKFGIEVTEYLEREHSVVYLLNAPPTGNSNDLGSLTGIDVLRQVSIQCLQQLSQQHWPMDSGIPFLVETTAKFKTASSLDDWFEVLRHILFRSHTLTIVVDLGILGRSWQEAQSWPDKCHGVLNGLRERESPNSSRILLLRHHNSLISKDIPVVTISATPGVGSFLNKVRSDRHRSKLPDTIANLTPNLLRALSDESQLPLWRQKDLMDSPWRPISSRKNPSDDPEMGGGYQFSQK
jgi:hypothetical protein